MGLFFLAVHPILGTAAIVSLIGIPALPALGMWADRALATRHVGRHRA